jgi:hypothetical protein
MAWTEGLDEATLGHASLNGWKAESDPAEVARAAVAAHLKAQAIIGSDPSKVLRLPMDANDADGWAKVHTALGAAKDPSEYKFEGVDDPTAARLRETAAKLHLSPAAAAELAKDVTGWGSTTKTAADEAARVKAASDDLALRQAWGGNYEQFKAGVDRSAALLGLTPEDVAAMAATKLGYVGTYEKLRGLAVRLGEAPLHGGDDKQPANGLVAMTREEATAKHAELMNDAAFVKRYMTPLDPGHNDAKALMTHVLSQKIGMPYGR